MKKRNLLFVCGLLFSFTLFAQRDLPEYFDLRDYDGVDYVTSVKNQQGGTCWTHGVMAAMEGNLLMTNVWTENGEVGEPALAEYHLDWWNGFNQHYNADLEPTSGSGLEVHMGGDYMVTTAYLSRNCGAVREVDGQSFDTPPIMEDTNFHYYYPRTVQWFTMDENLDGIDIIKNAIVDYGVLGTCMCYDNGFINNNYTHYQPPSNTQLPNHAIAIVGWDDNKETQAPENGAWIVKNSWGTGWGFDGYFYISYYDKWSCREPQMGAVSFQEVERKQYDFTYYHDYHGWRDTKEDCSEAFNAFTTTSDQALEALNFFFAADSSDFTIKIFDDFNGTTLENELYTFSGWNQYLGFNTIELEEEIGLAAGDDFYVYLYLEKGGQAYDRTSDVPVLLGGSSKTLVGSSASEGQSFYKDGEEWKDFYNYDDPSGFLNTGNFCIKALTVYDPNVGIGNQNNTFGNTLIQTVSPNPFSISTKINYILPGEMNVNLSIYNINGQLVKVLANGMQDGGIKTINWDGANDAGQKLSPGIYFMKLTAGNTSGTQKIILQ
jgi:C1A family cysteine protease